MTGVLVGNDGGEVVVGNDGGEVLGTGRQYHKKPPDLAQTLSFLSRNRAQTLSFLRSKIKKKQGGSGGQRPPDVVPEV